MYSCYKFKKMKSYYCIPDISSKEMRDMVILFARIVNLEIFTLQNFRQDTLIAPNLPAQTADSKAVLLGSILT